MTTEIIAVSNVVNGVNTITVPAKPEASSVLVGTSRDGQFVHDSQKMGTEAGFKNVSQLWVDKTITFEEGRRIMAEQRKEREDIEFNGSAIEFKADDKGVIVVIDDREFRPSMYALQKLCTWYGVPTTVATYYMNPPNNGKYERDESDYMCIAGLLHNGIRRLKSGKELLFRTYKDGTLRSVMSDQYSIVDNDWYLDQLSHLIKGGRLSHWRGDADTIYGNILIPDSIRVESDSEYGGMLSISNCEIGKRVIGQYPSIFRAICMNGCIWGQTKGEQFTKRHKGIHLDDLSAELEQNLNKQIPLLNSGRDLLLATRMWKLEAKQTNLFAAIQQLGKVTPAIAESFAIEYLNQGKNKTAFGIIDAMTRVSQLQSPDIQSDIDTFAGTLLIPRVWNNLQNYAKTLDDKIVARNLNQAV